MRYTAYRGTRQAKKVTVPERQRFGGPSSMLQDVFPNYGGFKGHTTALHMAEDIRAGGHKARVDAHSGYTAVYIRTNKR